MDYFDIKVSDFRAIFPIYKALVSFCAFDAWRLFCVCAHNACQQSFTVSISIHMSKTIPCTYSSPAISSKEEHPFSLMTILTAQRYSSIRIDQCRRDMCTLYKRSVRDDTHTSHAGDCAEQQ
mmetsp:Transcript_31387/g.51949  ORF Transcript_31387/g.51949 Transcript_31387/m.51949 type:complete len:122 (+) Transcript_31387:73-438(+)